MSLREIKEKYSKKYGNNWCLRKVSRLSKKGNHPSLTITSELKDIGVQPDDYVVVAVDGKKIIIEKID